jgi:fructose-bisphosphate aldolase class I
MVCNVKFLAALVVILAVCSNAFRMQVNKMNSASLKMALSDYKEELAKTAASIASPGRGILAVDESTKTIGKRLQSIGVENTEENRQSYRGLLFSAPGLGKYISGAILYEETLFQSDANGKPFVQTLKENGLFPGIKVDTGLQPLPGGHPIETWCEFLFVVVCSVYLYLQLFYC